MSDEALDRYLDQCDKDYERQGEGGCEMSEHVCEWRITYAWSSDYKINIPIIYCRVVGCKKELPIKDGLSRINAAERLSAEMVRTILEDFDLEFGDCEIFTKQCNALDAYADILEGK